MWKQIYLKIGHHDISILLYSISAIPEMLLIQKELSFHYCILKEKVESKDEILLEVKYRAHSNLKELKLIINFFVFQLLVWNFM